MIVLTRTSDLFVDFILIKDQLFLGLSGMLGGTESTNHGRESVCLSLLLVIGMAYCLTILNTALTGSMLLPSIMVHDVFTLTSSQTG